MRLDYGFVGIRKTPTRGPIERTTSAEPRCWRQSTTDRGEIAVEVGKTILTLMLIGLGIVALRYVLVVAYVALH